MMIQGHASGYRAAMPPNMGYASRYHLAGTIETDPKGLIPFLSASDSKERPYVRIIEDSLHLRSKPSISKSAQTGSKAKKDEIYLLIASAADKSKTWSEMQSASNLKEGEYEYLWYLVADPDDPNNIKGWITSVDVMKIDGKAVILYDTVEYATREEAAASDVSDVVEKNKASKIAMETKEKLIEAEKNRAASRSMTAAVVPGAGLSTGAKVAIAVGAAAVAFLLVRSARR